MPAFGIPGSGQWNKIESQHVKSVSTIYVLRELDTDAYARGVAARLDDLDWPGTLRVLVMPDGLDDLNDLHRDDPARFTGRLTVAMKSAEVYDANESDIDHPAVGVLLSDVTPERVEWLWLGRIPSGKVTLIDGDPGLGKSALTTDLAARVSTGRPMPDGEPCEAGGVVILTAEDALADTVRPRLDAAGANSTRIIAVPTVGTGEDEHMPSVPGDLGAIEVAIQRVDARLVIIDPLMAYLGGEVNSHRDQDVRRALAPIAQLAERTGVAVLIIRHLNKDQGGKAIYRGGGSIGISGAARSVLLVAEDPDDLDRRILVPVKANLT
ncbi:MAG: AAA family ATPase, partial [Vicinamibacterales bacterium]|nr:AAA family ATPase [Vicinamibacterales bacterium]